MAHLRDILLTGIALGIPAYCVFRSKRFGVPLGAVALWLLIFLCGEVACAWAGSPPEERRLAEVQEWLMGGWVYGLVYSMLLWLLKEAFLMARRAFLVYQAKTQSGLSATRAFLPIWQELNREPDAETWENRAT
jgi:hypothetical protein